ncbi:hypothetical protein PRVXT_002715 [Proteinivorax tanatarense]|uniref:Uncharacterized protein n=1 Tax=Proteinivorax tanatarense TaxID=1260629 RepID=A0AAU7VL37_9FIRM
MLKKRLMMVTALVLGGLFFLGAMPVEAVENAEQDETALARSPKYFARWYRDTSCFKYVTVRCACCGTSYQGYLSFQGEQNSNNEYLYAGSLYRTDLGFYPNPGPCGCCR